MRAKKRGAAGLDPAELPNRLLTVKELAGLLHRNTTLVFAVLVMKKEPMAKIGLARVVSPEVARRAVGHMAEFDREAEAACV